MKWVYRSTGNYQPRIMEKKLVQLKNPSHISSNQLKNLANQFKSIPLQLENKISTAQKYITYLIR
jgi:hypothetical protein